MRLPRARGVDQTPASRPRRGCGPCGSSSIPSTRAQSEHRLRPRLDDDRAHAPEQPDDSAAPRSPRPRPRCARRGCPRGASLCSERCARPQGPQPAWVGDEVHGTAPRGVHRELRPTHRRRPHRRRSVMGARGRGARWLGGSSPARREVVLAPRMRARHRCALTASAPGHTGHPGAPDIARGPRGRSPRHRRNSDNERSESRGRHRTVDTGSRREGLRRGLGVQLQRHWPGRRRGSSRSDGGPAWRQIGRDAPSPV